MDFDINVMRSVVTLVSLVLFLGLMLWTWSRKRKDFFDDAAQVPFLDDDAPVGTSDRT
ncbi:MAG: CcoQ/FixQ family Cbb3-type cytochrome c oxidase assembly chaperone [Burkholderiales bacterium PBB6]|nr:MAG: CcoQ/FixQ family Cbb3-type cytochrome c oxidase assembly chaperone [Burkholderiales bacterium PBB6]